MSLHQVLLVVALVLVAVSAFYEVPPRPSPPNLVLFRLGVAVFVLSFLVP